MKNSVAHFEIYTDDNDTLAKFYTSLFDWAIQPMPGMNYSWVKTIATNDKGMPTEPGGINGGLMNRTADTPTPVVTIGVVSIDESLKKVEAGGGSTVQPRTEIPEMGAFAYFKDSEGNVVGLWENL